MADDIFRHAEEFLSKVQNGHCRMFVGHFI